MIAAHQAFERACDKQLSELPGARDISAQLLAALTNCPVSSIDQLQCSKVPALPSYSNSANECWVNSLWFLLQRLPCFRHEIESSVRHNAAAGTCLRVLGPIWHACMRIADQAAYCAAAPEHRWLSVQRYATARDCLSAAYRLRRDKDVGAPRSGSPESADVALTYAVSYKDPLNAFQSFVFRQRVVRQCTLCSTAWDIQTTHVWSVLSLHDP